MAKAKINKSEVIRQLYAEGKTPTEIYAAMESKGISLSKSNIYTVVGQVKEREKEGTKQTQSVPASARNGTKPATKTQAKPTAVVAQRQVTVNGLLDMDSIAKLNEVIAKHGAKTITRYVELLGPILK